MDTKSRILDTSLDLFNEEPGVDHTAVDIANAVELSPGNLYYHYKGKDAIIAALFERFEEEMQIILQGSHGNVRSLEDVWVFLYVILEEVYDFRFFYRTPDTMVQRYPALGRRFRAILEGKERAIAAVIADLKAEEMIAIDDRLEAPLIAQIVSNLTFWLSLDTLRGGGDGDTVRGGSLIHETVFRIMTLVVPYMGEIGPPVLDGMASYYERVQKSAR